MAHSPLRVAKTVSQCSGTLMRASTSTLSKQATLSTLSFSLPTDTGCVPPLHPASRSLTLNPSMSRLFRSDLSLTWTWPWTGQSWMSSSLTLSTSAPTRASPSVCPSPGLQMARPCLVVSRTTWCASGPCHRRGYIRCSTMG
jgi:hypothetical protein